VKKNPLIQKVFGVPSFIHLEINFSLSTKSFIQEESDLELE
jgi:hypothetical protein